MANAAPLPYNHNGPPVFDEASDLPPGMPRMHYFKCDIDALWGVLVEMPFELGGFYMRAILAMYKHMEGLPADDNVARMRLGGMDIRTYRRMKAALLARPKCFVEKPSGRISNVRFEEEISSYVTEFKNRQKAGFEREEKRRSLPTSAELPPNFHPTSGELPAKVQEKSGELPANIDREKSKNHNKINGRDTTVLAQRDHNGTTTGVPRARVLELELDKETTLLSARDPEDGVSKSNPWRSKTKQLEDILREAAGECIGDPVNTAALSAVMEPLVWLDNGCDLKLDIVPTLRARGSKINPRSVHSWGYFTNAVRDARDKRLNLHAKLELPKEASSHDARRKHWLENTEHGREMVRSLGKNKAIEFYDEKVAPAMSGANAG